MYLKEQFRILYSTMVFTGVYSFWTGNICMLHKMVNYGYRNLLTAIAGVHLIVESCTDCNFARVVNCAEQLTVIGVEFFIEYQTLLYLFILRNYYLYYAREHQRLLSKLGYMCRIFNVNVPKLRYKYCLYVGLIIIPKSLLVFLYYTVLQDIMAMLMEWTLVFNTFSTSVCVIESSFVVSTLGSLFDQLAEANFDEASRHHYSITLLEMIDEINDFYGLIFLLTSIQQLSWMTVLVYKYWIFPTEMILFRDKFLQKLSKLAWSTTCFALIELVFTCQRTISKVSFFAS